ncbi:hypothetical protein BT96DRAFT_915466 [Gymnopus androsaceus JB14]|uniref:HNH nuclease domain-containing protein n=1 Tax=Gymnopus androsaceus JB14 TaxID=1447944 RepID=A0A6A4I6A1_9AGAR|nr:hypothetical protein BT96DRAFT_915466 [Gymnopus androsaceus JB14]
MAVIQVYAEQLRASSQPGSTNPANYEWSHILSFPVDTIVNIGFALRPLKWIRFATGVVTGTQGDLSASRNSLVAVDYNSSLPTDSLNLYYHVSVAERAAMFPLDPLFSAEAITDSQASFQTREGDFRSRVAARDEWAEDECDAVHMVSFKKGASYMRAFSSGRTRGQIIIDDINDTRNGILVRKDKRIVLGKNLAILKTPNFALNASDIIATANSNDELYIYTPFRRRRTRSSDTKTFGSNHCIRVPDDKSDWPPDFLFDAMYASAVLFHFHTQKTGSWREKFYSAAKTSQQVEFEKLKAEEALKKVNADAGAAARDERAAQRTSQRDGGGSDTWKEWACEQLLFWPYQNLSPSQLEAFGQAHRQQASVKECSNWLDRDQLRA